MNTVGVIGGIGPESTVEYYRHLIAAYRSLKPDGSYPSIIINSINLRAALDLVEANELEKLARHFATEIQKLANAGASVGLLAANTPHIVFDEIQQQSPIPLVSIVEATRDAAKALGLKRLGTLRHPLHHAGQFLSQYIFEDRHRATDASCGRAGVHPREIYG